MTTYILPYNSTSKSAKLLGEALDVRRLKQHNTGLNFEATDHIINWGCSRIYRCLGIARVFNSPSAVELAVDKLKTHACLKANNIPTLELTQDEETAKAWLSEGSIVFGRCTNTGSRGTGIEIIQEPSQINPFFLYYTKQYKHKREFRFHWVGDINIGTQIKLKRRNSTQERTPLRDLVKSHDNDWVFSYNLSLVPYIPHETAKETSKQALQALGLDFGAVDMLVKSNGECAVLEINTAPGIEGTTVTKYKDAFTNLILHP